MNNSIMNYFDEEIEYPGNLVIDNPLPYGILYEYVSCTFLNGFVNYCIPISCYVLDRYTDPDDIIVKYTDTKINCIEKIRNGELTDFHTDLAALQDDFIILAKIPEKENVYVFFWYDCDVSDCCIGKFESNDSESIIIDSVESWLVSLTSSEGGDNDITGYSRLPVSYLRGWKSF